MTRAATELTGSKGSPNKTLQQTAAAILVLRDTTALSAAAAAELSRSARRPVGLSYFYVNRDKEQFFDCGLAGLNSRFNRVGTEPGSRALAILLSDHGTWQGDRIAVIGDTSEEFEELVIRGIDIVVEAELMLMKFDGLGWVEECLDVSISMFQRMCCYALLLRHLDATAMLDRKYGVGKWQGRYEKHLQGNTDLWSQKVIDAKNRGLDLLRRRGG